MDIRHYLSIARRQRWVIIEAVVVVAILAGAFAALQTPKYKAAASVLLRADDLGEAESNVYYYDADRYVAVQSDIVKSRAVSDEVADSLGRSDPRQLSRRVSVVQKEATDIIEIAVTDSDPVIARDIANGFASAYIDNRRDDLVGNLQAVADRLDEQLSSLQAQIAEYDKQIEASSSRRLAGAAFGVVPPRDEALEAARSAATLQYQTVFARQQELEVDIGLKQGGAQLLAGAELPTGATGSGPLRSGVIGGVVGLLLGLGIALLREQLDDRAKTRAELERVTGLAVLAELPLDPPSARQKEHLATKDSSLGALAEATRSLRTSLHFLGVERPLRRITVTSASPGEGKSLVASNIAVAYAQAGFRTALVSADLRRPRLEQLFDIPVHARGLSDLILELASSAERVPAGVGAAPSPGGNGRGWAPHGEHGTPLEAALVGTEEPNLLVLPAGSIPPNPSELLASPHATELLDELGALVDVVILDTPPVLPVTDAAILAAKSDGVVLVAVPGETTRTAAQRARETLGNPQVRLLGLVLNKYRGPGPSDYRYGTDDASMTVKPWHGAKKRREVAASTATAR